jgi:hypothetical protein
MRTKSALRTAVATCALVVAVGVAQPIHAVPAVADDPAVIANWDRVAMQTSIAVGPPAQLYLGIVSAAMYNAVVTIEGEYEPYTTQPRAHANASPEAAAATAAYRVLLAMFPSASATLATEYQASLASIPAGVGRVHGIRVGEQAAAAILALREDDGRNDPSITSPPQTGDPGTWVATPPATAGTPMAAPWLGYVTPLLIDSCDDFELDGPDALGSAAYATDLAEVTEKGVATGSTRTADQTRTAWFFSDNAIRQYQEGRGLLAASEGLDIVESARMHALLNMTMADTLICTWKAKREFAFWRPITAIRTTTDPQWTPLLGGTPPYPEYPSGHASLSGPMSNGLEYLFPDGFDLQLQTAVPGASPTTPPTTTVRHYTSGTSLDTDTMNARIWLGIHFRTAMTDANAMGHDISDWAIDNYFQPVG